MTARRAALVAAGVAAAALVAWLVFIALPRWTSPRPAEPPPAVSTRAAPAAAPKIRARLYYLAEDGLHLQAADREVYFGEGTAEQARHLVEALLDPAPAPLSTLIPSGTTLRTLFLSGQGVAFVDLSGDASRKHGGGALDEILTVYSVVNTLTDNLPAITAVQILVDGREVDTLAGHVDLRRPLVRSTRWTERPAATAPPQAPAPPPAR
jgi:spore germination protein GerM